MKFFNFDGKKVDKVKKENVVMNAGRNMSRSVYDAHKYMSEEIIPKIVSDITSRYHTELTDAHMDIQKTNALLRDEYKVLSSMNLSEEEIKHELEQKLKQLLPRK